MNHLAEACNARNGITWRTLRNRKTAVQKLVARVAPGLPSSSECSIYRFNRAKCGTVSRIGALCRQSWRRGKQTRYGTRRGAIGAASPGWERQAYGDHFQVSGDNKPFGFDYRTPDAAKVTSPLTPTAGVAPGPRLPTECVEART